MSVARKKKDPNDLVQYIPSKIKSGIYEYTVEIRPLRHDKEDNEGECQFREKKILLSDELCYNISEPNWRLTIEVLFHEILHSYNLNVGIHSGFFDFQGKTSDQVEEIFVDFHARHFIQMLYENPMLLDLLLLMRNHE